MATRRSSKQDTIDRLEQDNAALKSTNEGLALQVRTQDEPAPLPVDMLAPRPVDSLGVNETATALAAAQAKAGVEARFLVALNRPRSIDAARVGLLKDCKRPNFAEVATFERPVGGEHMATGPSIRFAEAAARSWGNLDVDARTLYDSPEKRIVAVKVTDLESNVTWGVEIAIRKTVERRKLRKGQNPIATRTNAGGSTVYVVEASEDDLLAKGNALISKAVRTAILRHLPGDLVDEGQRACAATLRDRSAQDPDADRKRIIDGFASLGVPVVELADFLGHDIGTASPPEMALLRGVYTSIKEGDANWYEILSARRDDRGDRPGSSGGRSADVKASVAARAKGANGATRPPKQPPAPPAAKPPKAKTPAPAPAPEAGFDAEDGRVAPEDEPTDAELGLSTESSQGGSPEVKGQKTSGSPDPKPEPPPAAATKPVALVPDPAAPAGDFSSDNGLDMPPPLQGGTVDPEPAESADPRAGCPDCPDCGNPMLVSASDPDFYVCIPCDRYVKRAG